MEHVVSDIRVDIEAPHYVIHSSLRLLFTCVVLLCIYYSWLGGTIDEPCLLTLSLSLSLSLDCV